METIEAKNDGAVQINNAPLLCPKVAVIRIKSKKKKRRADELLDNLAQFKNLLILFINAYHKEYGQYVLNISFLYAMLTGKDYRSKDAQKQAGFAEFLKQAQAAGTTAYYLELMRKQKGKIDNNYLLQTTIRGIVGAFKSYRKALADYTERPDKYTGRPKPPRAKKVKELPSTSVEFNESCMEVEPTRLVLRIQIVCGVCIGIALPEEARGKEIKSARLIRIGSDYYVHLVYAETRPIAEAKGDFQAGIDVGLDNLLAVVSDNPDLASFIVSGKELKAFNQWFNKQKAHRQARIDSLKQDGKEDGVDRLRQIAEIYEELRHLSALRKRFFDNDLHKISRKLVDLLYQTGHRVIYIGTGGTDSKQGINLGKRNNQNFVSIPFRRLLDMITYKAALLGMRVIETREHYTSKSSSISDDIVQIQNLVDRGKRNEVAFSGKRIHRGLYMDCLLDKVFNADLNGALNILKAGAMLHKLTLPLKTLLFKLANPIRATLAIFYYKVSGESLIAGSIT